MSTRMPCSCRLRQTFSSEMELSNFDQVLDDLFTETGRSQGAGRGVPGNLRVPKMIEDGLEANRPDAFYQVKSESRKVWGRSTQAPWSATELPDLRMGTEYHNKNTRVKHGYLRIYRRE